MLPHYSVWQTIRGKIAVGTGLFLVMLLLLGGIASYDLGRIDRAARLIDMVDDLRSDVLEMRRYEKNLQLFPGRQGDLAALRSFVELTRERATAVGRIIMLPWAAVWAMVRTAPSTCCLKVLEPTRLCWTTNHPTGRPLPIRGSA